MWLHSLVCVGPGRKPRRPVFSQRGSYGSTDILGYRYLKRYRKYSRPSKACAGLKPLVTNRLSHPYRLDEPISILRGIRSDFSFLFHFSIEFMKTNRITPDGTPRFAFPIWSYSVCLCPIKRTDLSHVTIISKKFSINAP